MPHANCSSSRCACQAGQRKCAARSQRRWFFIMLCQNLSWSSLSMSRCKISIAIYFIFVLCFSFPAFPFLLMGEISSSPVSQAKYQVAVSFWLWHFFLFLSPQGWCIVYVFLNQDSVSCQTCWYQRVKGYITMMRCNLHVMWRGCFTIKLH